VRARFLLRALRVRKSPRFEKRPNKHNALLPQHNNPKINYSFRAYVAEHSLEHLHHRLPDQRSPPTLPTDVRLAVQELAGARAIADGALARAFPAGASESRSREPHVDLIESDGRKGPQVIERLARSAEIATREVAGGAGRRPGPPARDAARYDAVTVGRSGAIACAGEYGRPLCEKAASRGMEGARDEHEGKPGGGPQARSG